MPEKNLNDWKNLTDDELISQLMPDPNNPDVNVVFGIFLGKDTNEKLIRLYTTLQLNQYFQIPKDKILGVKRFPSDRIALWIPGDLKVQLTATASLSGDFLKGSIQAARSASGNRGTTINSILAAMVGNGGGVTDFFPGCVSNSGTPDPFCQPPPTPPTGCGCKSF